MCMHQARTAGQPGPPGGHPGGQAGQACHQTARSQRQSRWGLGVLPSLPSCPGPGRPSKMSLQKTLALLAEAPMSAGQASQPSHIRGQKLVDTAPRHSSQPLAQWYDLLCQLTAHRQGQRLTNIAPIHLLSRSTTSAGSEAPAVLLICHSIVLRQS